MSLYAAAHDTSSREGGWCALRLRLRALPVHYSRNLVVFGLALCLIGLTWSRWPSPRSGSYELASLWDEDLAEQLDRELMVWSGHYHRPFREERRQSLLAHKRIFQVGKYSDMTEEQRSWTERNPDWQYTFFDDSAMDKYVETTFWDVPRLRALYFNLPHIVMRADLFRLLVIYAEGGIYSDLDTFCLKPIDEWLIDRAQLADPGLELLLGVELDVLDWSDDLVRQWRFPGRWGVIQWTLWGRRGAPALRAAIIATAERIIAFAREQGIDANTVLHKSAAGNGSAEDVLEARLADRMLTMHFANMDILRLTGPRMLTETIMSYMGRPDQLGPGGFRVTDYSGLQKPKRAGNLLILPVTYWSPGIPHSGSKPLDDPQAAVSHEFRGSWRDGGPGAY